MYIGLAFALIMAVVIIGTLWTHRHRFLGSSERARRFERRLSVNDSGHHTLDHDD